MRKIKCMTLNFMHQFKRMSRNLSELEEPEAEESREKRRLEEEKSKIPIYDKANS